MIIEELKIKIPSSKVKQELGYKRHTVCSENINNLITELINKAYNLINPRGNYVILDQIKITKEHINLGGGKITFQSSDIARLLTNQRKVALLAVTIGEQLEKKVDQLFEQNEFTKATALDAVGSVAAEETANELTTKIKQKAEELQLSHLTMRFSPGYGDTKLDLQPKLLELVSGDKLGIKVNSSNLLIPRKSITALIGLGTRPGPKPGCDFNCRSCSFNSCIYN